MKTGREVVLLNNNNSSFVNLKELIIDSCVGNDLIFDLEICHYIQLERIIVKICSLLNIHSITISNNPYLSEISIGERSFLNTYSLSLSGIYYIILIIDRAS